MKKRSFFSQIVLLIILSVVCVLLTVTLALFAGMQDNVIFDFSKLNIGNVIPILIIGGFISCVVVGITVLFIGRSIFTKAKKYFSEDKGGENDELY